MRGIGRRINWVFMVLLPVSVTSPSLSLTKDQELSPEELTAEHQKSIGSPAIVEGMHTREITGTAMVQILQGAFGQQAGQAQITSDGRKLGIFLKFDNLDYPGEHFAFDGKDVTVGRFKQGKLTPLAEFINRFDGLIREGLLGGVLSTGWSLVNIKETKPRLKYKKAKLEGRPVHAIEYRPRRGLGDLKIVLFFEPETFHHIRTEYKLHISAAFGTTDSYYLLSEDFADFKEVDAMMLPHQYTLSFSSEGSGRSFLAHWIFNATQWNHNKQVDSLMFSATE